MKSKSTLRNFLSAIGACIIVLSSASAATLYWDGGDEDILTDGNGASGGTAGTWDTTILNWDEGTSPHVAWNNSNNDTAVFASTAGTVTLGTDVTVGGLTFNTNAYIIAPGTGPFGINFGAAGDINVSTGTTTTINAAISGSAITKTGGGTLRLTPASTFSGLNLNGGTTEVNGTTDSLGAAGSTITVLGNSTLRQGSSGAIVLDKSLAVNSEVTLTFIHGNNNWTILGPVSGSGVIRPNDAGSVFQRTLNLRSTSNTFTGVINLSNNNSAIAVNSLADASDNDNIVFTGANAGFRFGAGGDGPASSLVLGNRQLEFTAAGGTARIDSAAPTAHTFTINTDLLVSESIESGTKTLQLEGSNTGNNAFNGLIANGGLDTLNLSKAGNGKWILGNAANSYIGTTTLSAGTLEVTKLADGGSNSSIGSSAALVNNLRLLANTTLRYTGSGDSTNRNFSLQGSATLDSSGTGALTFSESGSLSPDVTALSGTFVENSSTVTVASTDNLAVGMSVISDAFTGTRTINAITSGTSIIISSGSGVLAGDFTLNAGIPVNRTLTLRGSNENANTISSILQNSTAITTTSNGVLSLAKNDGGTWVLSGDNTYTGTTTLSAGTLLVNGNQTSATGNVLVNATSTLGGSGTLGGNTFVAATANLAPGGASVGTLSFSGNLTLSETLNDVGTLHFDLGSIASSDRITVTGTLNVGTDALGLSDFNFTNGGGLQNGSYTLIASGAEIAGPLAAGDLTGTFGGADIELKIVGNDLVLEVTGVGGSTPYEDWATGGELFEEDANGDGVSNGLAFLLGASGPDANALGLLPAVTETGGGLVMTFSMLNSANRGTSALNIEHSSDLGIADPWTTVLLPDTAGISGPISGVTFDVTLGSPTNTVTATISSAEAASGKLFGRLKATE